MVGQSKTESVSVRFEPYIQELREFLGSRGVRYGSPADVVPFAERVNLPGQFQDEMGSMVRSILFREGESLGRGDLLALVAVAVGGPEIETAAQEMHASVGQMFVFINAALRQRERMFSSGLDEGHVTAGDVLAASSAGGEVEERTVGGRSPENDKFRRSTETPEVEYRATQERVAPESSGMLFRAVSMSSGDEGGGLPPEENVRRRWLIPAIAAAVVVLGAGAYFAKTTLDHSSSRAVTTAGTAQTQTGVATAAGACVGSPAPGTSRSALEERSRWAHRLLDQKLYEAALPELKSVAQIDPGYPGVNLDQSKALLNLKRPDDARQAIDTQIGISECMAKLPSAALDSYCNAEFSPAAAGACRPELTRIRGAAQLQAALVHLELGHRFAPEGAPQPVLADVPRGIPNESTPVTRTQPTANVVSRPVVRVRHTEPLPTGTEGDADRPAPVRSVAAAKVPTAKTPAATKPGKKSEGDDSLIRGEGTDSSLGAYSKPQ